jgi:hypothetical protein
LPAVHPIAAPGRVVASRGARCAGPAGEHGAGIARYIRDADDPQAATTANAEPAICKTHSQIICARMQMAKTRPPNPPIRQGDCGLDKNGEVDPNDFAAASDMQLSA